MIAPSIDVEATRRRGQLRRELDWPAELPKEDAKAALEALRPAIVALDIFGWTRCRQQPNGAFRWVAFNERGHVVVAEAWDDAPGLAIRGDRIPTNLIANRATLIAELSRLAWRGYGTKPPVDQLLALIVWATLDVNGHGDDEGAAMALLLGMMRDAREGRYGS